MTLFLLRFLKIRNKPNAAQASAATSNTAVSNTQERPCTTAGSARGRVAEGVDVDGTLVGLGETGVAVGEPLVAVGTAEGGVPCAGMCA